MKDKKRQAGAIYLRASQHPRIAPGSLVILIASLAVSGCSSVSSNAPVGPQAYAIVPHAPPQTERYLINSADTVTVSVFREPELSVADRVVDGGGNLNLPLIGDIEARGKTASELSDEIQLRLTRFVVDPKVSIGVISARQSVAVEGSVNQPGIYPIPGRASLLETIALARSPTRIAALDQVFVFRTVNGQEQAARFDLRKIRAAQDPDPVILPGDKVVVGISNVKEIWLEYLSIPVFNVFRTF